MPKVTKVVRKLHAPAAGSKRAKEMELEMKVSPTNSTPEPTSVSCGNASV